MSPMLRETLLARAKARRAIAAKRAAEEAAASRDAGQLSNAEQVAAAKAVQLHKHNLRLKLKHLAALHAQHLKAIADQQAVAAQAAAAQAAALRAKQALALSAQQAAGRKAALAAQQAAVRRAKHLIALKAQQAAAQNVAALKAEHAQTLAIQQAAALKAAAIHAQHLQAAAAQQAAAKAATAQAAVVRAQHLRDLVAQQAVAQAAKQRQVIAQRSAAKNAASLAKRQSVVSRSLLPATPNSLDAIRPPTATAQPAPSAVLPSVVLKPAPALVAKPVAKPALAPVVKPVVAKSSPGAVKHNVGKTAAARSSAPPKSVLDLTRDAGSASYAAAGARYPWADIVRWVVASSVVILGIVVVLRILKKRGIGVGVSSSVAAGAPAGQLAAKSAPLPTAKVNTGALGNVLGAGLANAKMGGDLEVVGAQPLNGSGNVLFLVRAGDRMLLLNSNPNTGVKPVSEWDSDDDGELDEPPVAFSSYLKESSGLRLSRPADDEAADAVRTRLTQAASRLARISSAAPRELD